MDWNLPLPIYTKEEIILLSQLLANKRISFLRRHPGFTSLRSLRRFIKSDNQRQCPFRILFKNIPLYLGSDDTSEYSSWNDVVLRWRLEIGK